jgi:hypothetical protein
MFLVELISLAQFFIYFTLLTITMRNKKMLAPILFFFIGFIAMAQEIPPPPLPPPPPGLPYRQWLDYLFIAGPLTGIQVLQL